MPEFSGKSWQPITSWDFSSLHHLLQHVIADKFYEKGLRVCNLCLHWTCKLIWRKKSSSNKESHCNAAVNCKTHYRTPGNSASWMGHLPHISDERYRLGSLWSVTTLTNECVNDGHFTWVRPFPMTYDTVVGGIEKSRHAKCVRSAWPVCIDSVARCGSSTTCASMELARCGSSATCASMELQSFRVFSFPR